MSSEIQLADINFRLESLRKSSSNNSELNSNKKKKCCCLCFLFFLILAVIAFVVLRFTEPGQQWLKHLEMCPEQGWICAPPPEEAEVPPPIIEEIVEEVEDDDTKDCLSIADVSVHTNGHWK